MAGDSAVHLALAARATEVRPLARRHRDLLGRGEDPWLERWILGCLAGDAPREEAVPGSCDDLLVWAAVTKATDVHDLFGRLAPFLRDVIDRDPDCRPSLCVQYLEGGPDSLCLEIFGREAMEWDAHHSIPTSAASPFWQAHGVLVRRHEVPVGWLPLDAGAPQTLPADCRARSLHVSLLAGSHDPIAEIARAAQPTGASGSAGEIVSAYRAALAARSGVTPGPKGGLSAWACAGRDLDVSGFVMAAKPLWQSMLEEEGDGSVLVVYQPEGALAGCFTVGLEDGADGVRVRHHELPYALRWGPAVLAR